MRAEQARFRELVRRLKDDEIDGAEALELRARLDEILNPGGVWMFLRWGERRMSQVYPALLEAPESGNAFGLMTAAALSLRPETGQRTTMTMAQLAARLNFSSSQLARAVATLVSLDVFQVPQRAGKSQTFEMDARLVTRLEEAARKAAAARQELWRRGRSVSEQAAGEDAGPVEDERQGELEAVTTPQPV